MDDQTPASAIPSDSAAPQAAPVPPPAPWAAAAAGPRPSWFRRHTRGLAIAGAAALCLTLGGGGAAALALQRQAAEAAYASPYGGGVDRSSGQGGSFGPGGPGGWGGAGGQGTSTGSGSTTSSATAATAAQQAGVVTITTEVQYGQGEAAGTGMILTSDGEVLTNNHVVEGSTSIEVTVESTGRTYTAEVVGTDATDDVALLQLEGASGLTPVSIDSDGVSTGDAITDVGNAEGTGNLVAAAGTITATDQQITVQDELTGDPKSLDGLLELDADIVSGDSGGPVLDSDGEVVGIATAASSGSQQVTGYAIPIAHALSVVQQIRSGVETSTVQIGLPAFLGVQLSQSSTGATIAGTVDGSAAASAGLGAGDTITAVDGTPIATADALSAAIAQHEPGDSVQVTYTDAGGASATVTVTLGSGPAA